MTGRDIISGNVDPPEKTSSTSDPYAGLSIEEKTKAERDLLRKLDLRLVPWLALLYLVSFIDRANIGNAKIEGLIDDLHMTEGQYNLCLTVFFLPYSITEPLSNVLLKKLKPRIYIPVIMFLWGICMTSMGFTKDFGGMLAARFFLGLTEAGLFPGVNYYLSCWYKRSELGIRAAIFFSAAAVSGSFGGLLAAGISQMRGIGGYPGWAWIFLLEGGVTILIGLASFWMVYDFPTDESASKFLTPLERARVIKRLKEDRQASATSEKFEMLYFWQSVGDAHMYVGCIIYMGVAGSLYAFSLFLPSIIKELGFSSTKAQLLTVPPYVVACALTVFVGWYSDRVNKRGVFNIFTSLIGVIGFMILVASRSATLSYVATFLGALGIYPCISNTITWVSGNTEGVYKRGVTLGFVIGMGNLNGIMASNVYRSRDAPHYTMGHAVVLGYLSALLFGGSCLNYWILRTENRKRLEGLRDHLMEGLSEVEIKKLGDKKSDFLYTL